MADEADHGPHLPRIYPLSAAPGPPPIVAPPVVAPPVVAEKPAAPRIDLSREDVLCRTCGFNLRGLTEQGNCPECGTPIWNSIQEDLMRYSSTAYIASLHRGVNCILIAALLKIALVVLGIVVGIALFVALSTGGTGAGNAPTGGTAPFGITTTASSVFDAIVQLVSLPIELLALYGWWLFSSPDPGHGLTDTGQKPRRIVRIAVITLAATTVLATAAQFMVMMVPAVAIAVAALGLVALAAMVAQYFAAMLYLRWMGPRIPDRVVEERAKLYMWLLPVFYVVGLCALGLGPLVALIMYLLLLNRVRIDIRNLRQQLQPQPDEEFSAPA
jgi:hypothetical protein